MLGTATRDGEEVLDLGANTTGSSLDRRLPTLRRSFVALSPPSAALVVVVAGVEEDEGRFILLEFLAMLHSIVFPVALYCIIVFYSIMIRCCMY